MSGSDYSTVGRVAKALLGKRTTVNKAIDLALATMDGAPKFSKGQRQQLVTRLKIERAQLLKVEVCNE